MPDVPSATPAGARLGFCCSAAYAVAFLPFLVPALAAAQVPEVRPGTYEEIRAALQRSEAPVKVVNVWATWCIPCREELPYFVKVGRDFARDGVEVIFVSADMEEDLPQVQAFLAEQDVTSVSYLIRGDPNAFINAFHEAWSGALPATFLYGPDGALKMFWEGAVTHEQLRERVTVLLETLLY